MQSFPIFFSTGHLISTNIMTKEVHQNCETHSPWVGTLVFKWSFIDHIPYLKCMNLILKKSFGVLQDIGRHFKYIGGFFPNFKIHYPI